MVERLPAKRYYGSHATGTVVLVNGQPHHFTGSGQKADADAFVARLTPMPDVAKLAPPLS